MPDRSRTPPGRPQPQRFKNPPTSLPAPVARAIGALARDHRSGSVILALRACALLENCKLPPSEPASDFYRRVAQAVALAQPTMAAVWNVCDRWLHHVQGGTTPLRSARRVARELSRTQRAASAHAAALVQNEQAVVTYSASSTVESAFLIARHNGRHFRVLCAEGRPKYEGRDLAQRLAAHGVPVEFFTDAALLASLASADLVLVGCDAVFPNGFVNKVGTHALLRMARSVRVLAYVVADSFKFLPAAAEGSFSIREEPSAEVWKRAPRNLHVKNFYFEKVPLGACSGLITDQGLCSPKEVAALLLAVESGGMLDQAQKLSRRGHSLRR